MRFSRRRGGEGITERSCASPTVAAFAVDAVWAAAVGCVVASAVGVSCTDAIEADAVNRTAEDADGGFVDCGAFAIDS